jgi:hypothetical protein
MSSPKISKSSILSALNETTKQAAKAEAEKKRLAEEKQKAKELKREQGCRELIPEFRCPSALFSKSPPEKVKINPRYKKMSRLFEKGAKEHQNSGITSNIVLHCCAICPQCARRRRQEGQREVYSNSSAPTHTSLATLNNFLLSANY